MMSLVPHDPLSLHSNLTFTLSLSPFLLRLNFQLARSSDTHQRRLKVFNDESNDSSSLGHHVTCKPVSFASQCMIEFWSCYSRLWTSAPGDVCLNTGAYSLIYYGYPNNVFLPPAQTFSRMKTGSTPKSSWFSLQICLFPTLETPPTRVCTGNLRPWRHFSAASLHTSYSCELSVTSLLQMCPLFFISTGTMGVLPHSSIWTVAAAFQWTLFPLSMPIFPSMCSPYSSQGGLWSYTTDHSIPMIKILQFYFSWRRTKLPDMLPEIS